MVGTSSSSSSSSGASFGSFDDVGVKAGSNTVKFLCSYGGRILPRYPDGKLRYVGGDTRVLAVDRSVPFSELQVKLGELCGWAAVSIRCQLPADDLDALVSVTSDEDLANLIEEYDIAARARTSPLKIRAFLLPVPASPPAVAPKPTAIRPAARPPISARCVRPKCPAAGRTERSAGEVRFRGHQQPCGAQRGHHYLVHHGSHWH